MSDYFGRDVLYFRDETMRAPSSGEGQVIGPDKNHLMTKLQGEAEAAAKMKVIINAAKAQGRDPQPDVERAIADEPRGSATGGWLVWFIHDSKLGGGRWEVPPQMELLYSYRK